MVWLEQRAEIPRMHFVLGLSIKEIARRTGRDRNMVRRALRASTAPKYQRPSGPSKLDPSGPASNDRTTQGALLLDEAAYPVRPGSVVARPPATRVAHASRARDGGLTLLAFGSRDPNDIAFFPRSGKVSLRGIGLRSRVDRLDYWDGEPD